MNSIPSLVEKLTIHCDADRSARDANSVLSPNRPDEEVTLISPHPDWNGLTLGNLKNISGLAAARLVRDQGLTPSEGPPDLEQARISNLNMILKHLGVSCARLDLSPDLNRLTTNPVSGAIPGHSFMEWDSPHLSYEKDKPLITPVEAPLYLFLVYLTLFVYSSIVL